MKFIKILFCYYATCSNSLCIFVVLCWICYSMSMPFLHCEAQNQAQPSRCGVIRTQHRGTISSLDGLVMPFLMEPRKLVCIVARTHIAGSHSTWCLSGHTVLLFRADFPSLGIPACVDAWGYYSLCKGLCISC